MSANIRKVTRGLPPKVSKVILDAVHAYEQQIMDRLPSRVRKIVSDVSESSGAPIYLIFSASKRPAAFLARWETMYRVKEGNPSLSFPRIAEWFDVDHTTVIHGIARHAAITGKPPLTGHDLTNRVKDPKTWNGMQL